MYIWFFNFILYLTYVYNPPAYQQMVAQGTPCWIQADATYLPTMGLGDSSNVQPACWYDPSNTNDGHAHVAFAGGPGNHGSDSIITKGARRAK